MPCASDAQQTCHTLVACINLPGGPLTDMGASPACSALLWRSRSATLARHPCSCSGVVLGGQAGGRQAGRQGGLSHNDAAPQAANHASQCRLAARPCLALTPAALPTGGGTRRVARRRPPPSCRCSTGPTPCGAQRWHCRRRSAAALPSASCGWPMGGCCSCMLTGQVGGGLWEPGWRTPFARSNLPAVQPSQSLPPRCCHKF